MAEGKRITRKAEKGKTFRTKHTGFDPKSKTSADKRPTVKKKKSLKKQGVRKGR